MKQESEHLRRSELHIFCSFTLLQLCTGSINSVCRGRSESHCGRDLYPGCTSVSGVWGLTRNVVFHSVIYMLRGIPQRATWGILKRLFLNHIWMHSDYNSLVIHKLIKKMPFRAFRSARQCGHVAIQPYLQAVSQHVRLWTCGGGTLRREAWRNQTTPAATSLPICSGLKLWVEICWVHATLINVGILTKASPPVLTCHFICRSKALSMRI